MKKEAGTRVPINVKAMLISSSYEEKNMKEVVKALKGRKSSLNIVELVNSSERSEHLIKKGGE
jgi:hypothetical protein